MWKKIEPNQTATWNGKEDGEWKLSKGDELVGTYETKQQNIGPNDSILYEIKTDDGMVAVWGSTVLDTRLKNIEPGERVKIIYKGKEKSERTGREYHDYEIYHWEEEIIK
jgi:hypothetical protein